ncbi:lipopolysaccharide biosynthesis protein [uncultured Christiangramia sp.]|uniref:lipopolysaccharide biosynthesis protein n=1 Tax=uncultured Christiangramia sp. TaxID=503836 RepID=UPI00262E15A8|nr:lipopolysaccharide biosynthesis protein [uncultured Christiangramia sp.]
MLKGILYTAASKYSGVLITIGITAILSRLLTPAEFGIVALVTVFIGFFNLLGTLGVGPAIVQSKELSNLDLRSIFSFSALMALLLAAVFFALAEVISNFYEEPELVLIVRLLSLSIFFNILSIVPKALNRKKLRFKQMGVVTVIVQFVTGIVAIWMAYADYSYYAIVVQNILSGFLLFLVFYLLYPVLPIIRISAKPLRSIAAFSSYQFAFNFINYFSRNLDNIFIGKYLGNASLGFYNKSYTLMQLPVANLTHVITPVLHPVLAKHQDDLKIIYSSYLNVVKILALIGFPLSVFLYYAAPELILIMFGPQWDKSIPVFKILALTVGLQMCLSSTGAIFQATNRTDLLFLSGLLSSIFMVSGILYGVFIGKSLESVGLGLLVAFTINFLAGFYMLIKKALRQSYLIFLQSFLLPLISAVVAFAIFSAISMMPLDNPIWSLILKVLVFGLITVGFSIISKDNRRILLKIIRRN